jgi:hypothetical protein
MCELEIQIRSSGLLSVDLFRWGLCRCSRLRISSHMTEALWLMCPSQDKQNPTLSFEGTKEGEWSGGELVLPLVVPKRCGNILARSSGF